MASYAFQLSNEHGLHARPAGLLVQVSSKFDSKVCLVKNGQSYNCKSMLGILKMAGSKGDELVLEVEGTDEAEALQAIQTLITANFNE